MLYDESVKLKGTLMPMRALVIAVLLLMPVRVAAEDSPRGVLAEVVSKVRFFRLENGLRVIMYPRGSAPVFGGAVGVRVGGTDEAVGETGVSHMFEHMAFKGTPVLGTSNYPRERVLLGEVEKLEQQRIAAGELSADQISRLTSLQTELNGLWDRNAFVSELQKRGASDLNATTDKELTRYFMNLPRAAFEFWCWMESERLLNPVLREFYQERDVVMEEKRMRYTDSPQGRLYETLLQVAYLAHPYRNPIIGYDEDLKNLTATSVDAFRKKFYVPGNIVVAVVGAVSPDQDIEIIRKYFGKLPSAPLPERRLLDEPAQQGERQFTLHLKAAPQMLIAYHKPSYPHPDDPAISMAMEMFAGSNTSPLYTELVKRRKLASGVGHEEGPGAAYPNLNLFSLETRQPHSNDELLHSFDQTFDKFRAGNFNERDLLIAKRRVAMAHLGSLKSNLSMAIDFVSSELLYQNWNAFLDWYDKAMNVSVADIKRVSRQYFDRSNRTIARLEPLSQEAK